MPSVLTYLSTLAQASSVCSLETASWSRLLISRCVRWSVRALWTGTVAMNNLLKIYTDGDEVVTQKALDTAASVLKRGGVVALPTDTIYGIAASVSSDEAIKKLYSIKGRKNHKPIAICVSDVQDISKWAKCEKYSDLLKDLLPGKVTTVFERKDVLNPNLNPGNPLVGVRIPDHWFVRQLVSRCGHPIALTSANISDTRSTLDVEEFRELWSQLELVIDGGRIVEGEDPTSRLGSTVINFSEGDKFSIIRAGTTYDDVVQLLKGKYQMTEVFPT